MPVAGGRCAKSKGVPVSEEPRSIARFRNLCTVKKFLGFNVLVTAALFQGIPIPYEA